MPNMQRVVIWDEKCEYLEGEVVDGNKSEALAARRAGVLSLDADLLTLNGSAGYAVRKFGKGWSFDPHMPKHGAPVALYVVPDRPLIHWLAKLVPSPAAFDAPAVQPRGNLRLNVDTSQRGIVSARVTSETPPVELSALSPQFETGGWLIGGTNRFASSIEGFLGLSLYGTAQHCRVAWLAVSQSH
jgi:hypothetical protein